MIRRGRGRKEGDDRTLTIMLVPDGGKRTRTLRIPYGRLRWLWPAAAALGLVCAFMIGSWGYLALRADRARILEDEVVRLTQREARVEELAQSLAEVEAAYDRLRDLFGAGAPPDARDLWLPPATGRPVAPRSVAEEDGDLLRPGR